MEYIVNRLQHWQIRLIGVCLEIKKRNLSKIEIIIIMNLNI